MSQKMEQKEPEKKTPSMQAKATRRWAKELDEPVKGTPWAAPKKKDISGR